MANTIGPYRLDPKGTYSALIEYSLLDWVTDESGDSYVYINPSASTGTTLSNTSYWTKFINLENVRQAISYINAAFTGKVLWADGDSLTYGYGLDPDPVTGIIPSYAYLVARRMGMEFHNGAIGGSTVAFSLVNNGDFYSFTNPVSPRYANIPESADYITLYFGRNDYMRGPASARDTYCVATYSDYYDNLTTEQKALADAHSAFITEWIGAVGTLDVHTWIGAWETVFQYLMANHPAARVGILISELPDDSLGNGMRQSLVSLCAKYGYPCLDTANRNLWLDVGTFPLYGTDPIQLARQAAYTNDSIHPNELGHEIQSVQFEGWLRSGFIAGGGAEVQAADSPDSPWRSIVCDIRPDGTGETDPSLAVFYSILKGYLFAVGDQVWLRFKIPHDYKPGTDIYLAIDWNHISAGVTGGNMTFQIDFAYGKAHGDTGGFGNVYSIAIVGSAGVWYQLMTAESVISDAVGTSKINHGLLEPDGIILMRLIVTANNMTGDQPGVFIHKASVNYQSTNVGTPSKDPDFWA
jgi:hypothetical protein